MAPSDKQGYTELQERLLDEADDLSSVDGRHRTHVRPGRLHFAALWFIIIIQAIAIMTLFFKPPSQKSNDFHLYSPADEVVEYQVKSFYFGIGDDLSPFQQPPSPELDEMWRQLYDFGVSRIPKDQAAKLPNKTAPIPGDPDGYYIAELEVFHQLHCLNMIRQALYPDYYPDMRLGTHKADEHIGHCIDAIRQSLMCSADVSTVVWQWDAKQRNNTFRGGVAHTCKNFEKIQQWARDRIILSHFQADIHMDDDIEIPLYREDGSTYWT